MGENTKEIRGEVTLFKIFSDDIVLVRENVEEVFIGWMSGG